MTCNFNEFHVHDMKKKKDKDIPEVIYLKDLPKEYNRLSFLVNKDNTSIQKENDLSVKAGEIIGKVYDKLIKQYNNIENKKSHESLNKLCVRLVFCLYAEDSELFKRKNQFHDYLAKFPASGIRQALVDLFKVLDTKEEDRQGLYLNEDVLDFPYVNGGLFTEEIEIPLFTDEIKDLVIKNASEDFDWSEISPTIFGATFESTLNPETRRSGGMHYTSIENINKVIYPLFMDELKNEYEQISKIKVKTTQKKRANEFQEKLASLKFLDPACGSGNFLTETYICLRKLENETIKLTSDGSLSLFDPIKVNINQFYGIEINDFAVSVAKTALWIAETQMKKETEGIFSFDVDYLPLKSNTNIIEGNALTLDWNEIVDKKELNYIIGNPPFVGARIMNEMQKKDLENIFEGYKNIGNLDYVSCWFKKSFDYIKGTIIKCALVSTNSISQGDSVATLWKPLFEEGICINFAYRTFIWDSESNSKAHVYCVIIGFSNIINNTKRIFYEDKWHDVKNINAYLNDADNIFIESRNTPICNVPQIGIGNQPIDDGNYLFSREEMEEFIKKEPSSKKYFHKWYGADEFINNRPRFCLYLGKCSPKDLISMPECKKRVDNIREFRLDSKRQSTLKAAEKPANFGTENIQENTYMIIPETSSENRNYIPMGFIDADSLASNAVRVVPNATHYIFGILTSIVHMAWMRVVAGRLKSDYRYSKDIVYNNFPWPNVDKATEDKITNTAKMILDAREKYKDSTLADMYGENMYLYSDLVKAHEENDKAVLKAYGFKENIKEEEIVSELFKMYEKITN